MKRAWKYVLWSVFAALGVASSFIWLGNNDFSNQELTILHNPHDYSVRITRNQNIITKQDTIKFTFTVQRDGNPAQLVEQKIYPHATIVSNNLHDIAFYHVDDLELLENDTYAFEHRFVTSGEYAIWIELNDNKTPQHHEAASDYTSRMNLSVSGVDEPYAPARLTSQDGPYRMQLIPDMLHIGSPSKFRILVTREDGQIVKLIKDIDHFFVTANPDENFYVLDHPDLPLTKDDEVTVSNSTFLEHGQYAFWIRLFPDNGTGEITSRIQGSFVLPQL